MLIYKPLNKVYVCRCCFFQDCSDPLVNDSRKKRYLFPVPSLASVFWSQDSGVPPKKNRMKQFQDRERDWRGSAWRSELMFFQFACFVSGVCCYCDSALHHLWEFYSALWYGIWKSVGVAVFTNQQLGLVQGPNPRCFLLPAPSRQKKKTILVVCTEEDRMWLKGCR